MGSVSGGYRASRKPNDVWCADYKGEFMLADRRYCYPLTVTDFESRYLLACEALSSTKEKYAFSVFERVFKEFGMPKTIRTDNGRHERMHRTLKAETTKPAGDNFLQQQGRFDDFIEYFNHERPHQALDMQSPAQHYARSTRPYSGVPSIDYPFHDKTVTVTACGRSLSPSGSCGEPNCAVLDIMSSGASRREGLCFGYALAGFLEDLPAYPDVERDDCKLNDQSEDAAITLVHVVSPSAARRPLDEWYERSPPRSY